MQKDENIRIGKAGLAVVLVLLMVVSSFSFLADIGSAAAPVAGVSVAGVETKVPVSVTNLAISIAAYSTLTTFKSNFVSIAFAFE